MVGGNVWCERRWRQLGMCVYLPPRQWCAPAGQAREYCTSERFMGQQAGGAAARLHRKINENKRG